MPVLGIVAPAVRCGRAGDVENNRTSGSIGGEAVSVKLPEGRNALLDLANIVGAVQLNGSVDV
jgi:hypothetical protein